MSYRELFTRKRALEDALLALKVDFDARMQAVPLAYRLSRWQHFVVSADVLALIYDLETVERQIDRFFGIRQEAA